MADTKEKLFDLMMRDPCPSPVICDPNCKYYKSHHCHAERYADHLIANGVTIQEWIPVTERLPEHFGVFIVAIREPYKERVGKDCADFDPFAKTWLPSMCWDKGYAVTHWMPLPEPPKGE